jgi:hypothetical protein
MPTVSIRIVAECGLHSCQVTRKLKQAANLGFITISAIIFILCYGLGFDIISLIILSIKSDSRKGNVMCK